MKETLFLIHWRLEKNMTQKALSSLSGLTQAQISRLETSGQRPTYRTIERLAKALAINPEALFSPPPGLRLELSRHEIDRVGKAVVSGQRNMKRSLNRLADDVARLVSSKLKAFQVPGGHLVSGKRRNTKFVFLKTKHLYPAGILDQILSRVDKALP